MKTYLVQHYFQGERPRRVGLFSSGKRARESVERLAKERGFREAKGILKTLDTPRASGFTITPFVVDEFLFRSVTPKSQLKKGVKLFLIEHRHTFSEGTFREVVLGVTSCEREAKHLIIKMKNRPEYRGAQELLERETVGDGFLITPIVLDHVDWTEGFHPPYSE